MIQQVESSAKWQLLGAVIAFTIAGVIFATASITNARSAAVQQDAAISEQSGMIGDLNTQLQQSRVWNTKLQDQLDLARRELATANATIQSLRSELAALRGSLTSAMNGGVSGSASQTPADLELMRVQLEEAGYMVLPLDDGVVVVVSGLIALALSALLAVVFVAMRRPRNS